MAEGVAEVEDGPQARFFLVLADDPGLDFHAALDGLGQCGLVLLAQGVDVLLQPGEEGHVGNRPVFDDFGQTCRQLPRGQGGQAVEVAQHQAWLVERADHVLALGVVDGRFAAHAGIDLGQQRGRDLHEGHAAHIAGSGKAGHVANHAAAQGKEHGFAVAAVFQQAVENLVERGPVLERLAIGQHHLPHLGVMPGQCGLQGRRVQRRHRGVGDDDRLRCLGTGGEAGSGLQQAAANENGVGTLTQIDPHAVQNFSHLPCLSFQNKELFALY